MTNSSDEEDIKLKKDMMEALATIEDPGQKVVLMLLVRSIDNISRKLDKVLADEEKLKHIVLNGSAKDHDAHHKWIDKQVNNSEDVVKTINFVKNRQDAGGYCDYASRMIASEKAEQEDKRKVKNDVVSKIILAGLGVILGALTFKYLGIP